MAFHKARCLRTPGWENSEVERMAMIGAQGSGCETMLNLRVPTVMARAEANHHVRAEAGHTTDQVNRLVWC